MKKFFKTLLLILLAASIVITFVYLYRKTRPAVVEWEVYSVERCDIVKSTVLTGTVQPRDEILIKPQISGIIAEIYKEAGQTVREGEVIAKVKVIPDMSALSSAESRVRLAGINAEQARINHERIENLYAKKLVSDEEYEKSKIALMQSQEEKANAEDALSIVRDGISKSNASSSTTLIRSTIDGLLLDIPVKVGNSVILSNTFNDGTTIATVANMNDLIFVGKIDETEVGRVSEGMPVVLTLGALQSRSFPATLEYIAPKATAENGANLFEVKAALTPPEDVVIRSGYSANASIVLEQADSVVSVPEGAIEFSGDSTYVYVLTASRPQAFERRAIVTGLSDGIHMEVRSGLAEGDQVRGNLKAKI